MFENYVYISNIKILENMIELNNGQSAALNLSNNQLQVLLTGVFGDGSIFKCNSNINYVYSTNCKFEEYLDFKISLLGDISGNKSFVKYNGYSNSPIWRFQTLVDERITAFKELDIEQYLSWMDHLGMAMWIYDDGSLHKNKLFYNINTQSFSREIQEDLFVPHFNKFGIFPKVTVENKKDGRVFYYLRISKYEGSYEIAKLLNEFPIKCYSYKVWSSETIQEWSKLQEQLKRAAIDPNTLHNRTLNSVLGKGMSIEDIVRTIEKSIERKNNRLSRNI